MKKKFKKAWWDKTIILLKIRTQTINQWKNIILKKQYNQNKILVDFFSADKNKI